MALYSKNQMTRPEKPKPEPGWHTMKVRKEMPAKSPSQHTFILENEKSEVWFNCFLPDLPAFGGACNIEIDSEGNFDTAVCLNQYVEVLIENKEWKGKFYPNVVDFRTASPDQIPTPALNPHDEEIPF